MTEYFTKILAYLRAMALYSQTAHWTCQGSEFYGDHLLLERLYGAYNEEIDGVGEKAVGLTSESTVGLPDSLQMALELVKDLPHGAASFEALGQLEHEFITLCTMADHTEGATLGFKNLVADLADRGEGRFYLIRQRIKKG